MFSREKAAGSFWWQSKQRHYLHLVSTKPSVSGFQTQKSFGLDVLFMVRVSMASVRDVLHSTFLYCLLLSLSFIESCLQFVYELASGRLLLLRLLNNIFGFDKSFSPLVI